jgi:C6 transcription factor Pro1
VAALQLVSFSLFSAGSTQWRPMLDIACEWLAQTGIIVDEDPKLTLRNMTSAGRFAAKTTMVRPFPTPLS